VPQHILRYWETRFPQLRPLQRAGNRRYYRPADVQLVRRIHSLLNVEGFTVRGAQKILSEAKGEAAKPQPKPAPSPAPVATAPAPASAPPAAPSEKPAVDRALIARLEAIRDQLAEALAEA
jgi:DNA-binding transcriptional MerR regulator